ncbi:hypothetical protein BS78_02G331500, partial [Paspalum vaginatum]
QPVPAERATGGVAPEAARHGEREGRAEAAKRPRMQQARPPPRRRRAPAIASPPSPTAPLKRAPRDRRLGSSYVSAASPRGRPRTPPRPPTCPSLCARPIGRPVLLKPRL